MRSMLRQPLLSMSSLFWGIQFSLLTPSLALLLVSLYGATPGEVGWSLAVYNAAGFVASLVIPAWADRRGEYLRPMLACGVLTLALALALWLATTLPLAVVALIAIGAPAGVGASLIFAHLVHSGLSPAELMNNRAIYSFAWVAGPPIATALLGWFGDSSLLVALGVVALLNVLTTALLIRRGGASVTVGSDEQEPSALSSGPRHTRPAAIVITVAFVLLQATNATTTVVLTLWVSEGLGLPVLWAGIALSLAAGLEIPALVWLGRLAERHALLGLLVIGCLAGVAYFAGMALVRDPWTILGLQVFNAVFVAALSGIGLMLFQQLVPGPGLASGIFGNTRRVGAILTGPLIALAGTPWGYPGVFAACAGLGVVATAALAGVGRGAGQTSSPQPASA